MAATVNQVGQFALGTINSLVLSAIAGALGFIGDLGCAVPAVLPQHQRSNFRSSVRRKAAASIQWIGA